MTTTPDHDTLSTAAADVTTRTFTLAVLAALVACTGVALAIASPRWLVLLPAYALVWHVVVSLFGGALVLLAEGAARIALAPIRWLTSRARREEGSR
jgi:hypothetical protein